MKYSILIQLMILSLTTFGQRRDPLANPFQETETVGIYIVGNVEYDFNYNYNLGAILRSKGLLAFDEQPMVYGAGIHIVQNRVQFRVDYMINYRKKENDDAIAKQRLNCFGVNVGYNVLKSQSWAIAPYVGIRFNALKYQYTEKLEDPTLAATIDANPVNLELRNSKIYLDAGLSFSNSKMHRVELRVGYATPLSKNKWWDENRVNSFSDISNYLTGFYFRFSLGIGRMNAF